MVAPSTETTPTEVRIQLKSGFPEGEYSDADGVQLSVPSHCGRKALRAVLRQLLSLEEDEGPDFHFLVNLETSGFPLRTTLSKFLARHKLSSESLLSLTYYLPLPTPKKRDSESPPHPSWLSCLSAHGNDLLAGSLCGAVLVNGETINGAHSAPVKAVTWSAGGKHFITAGQDECVRVWDCDTRVARAVLRAEDVGACSSFESVAAAEGVAAAGAFDGAIWLLPRVGLPSDEEGGGAEEDADANMEDANKKRKRPSESPIEAVRLGEPTGLCASAAMFNGPKTLLTGGWEGVVRSWDILSASLCSVIPAGGRAVTGLSVTNSTCIVSAVDGAVRVLDARGEQGVVTACKRRGAHKAAANDVDWVEEEKVAVSAGADGDVKVWDLRAMDEPVHTVRHGEEGVNVLAVAVLEDGTIASGGSDGKIAKFEMR